MIYIGIDPGVSGGLAFLDGAGTVLHTVSMPATERDLLTLLDEGFVEGQRGGLSVRPSRAMVERVNSSPGWGHAGAFTFGRNVGVIAMALTAARVPFDYVNPRDWQKTLGVTYPKAATSVVKKNITKRRAQQLFPTLTITHAIADALLLAEYCRRYDRGTNGKEEHAKSGADRQGEAQGHGTEASRAAGATEQGRGRARAAKGPDPEASRGTGRAAGNGKHGRRSQDGRHLQADRDAPRRNQRPAPR